MSFHDVKGTMIEKINSTYSSISLRCFILEMFTTRCSIIYTAKVNAMYARQINVAFKCLQFNCKNVMFNKSFLLLNAQTFVAI